MWFSTKQTVFNINNETGITLKFLWYNSIKYDYYFLFTFQTFLYFL